jgi:hypothetical protein
MLGGYQKSWLRFDMLAGLTAAAVVIPKCRPGRQPPTKENKYERSQAPFRR